MKPSAVGCTSRVGRCTSVGHTLEKGLSGCEVSPSLRLILMKEKNVYTSWGIDSTPRRKMWKKNGKKNKNISSSL
jgi:hypothetical protein